MGSGTGVRQGLLITVDSVVYTAAMSKNKTNPKPLSHGKLVRETDVAIVGDPGVPAAASQAMRQLGLKIGMRFRSAHHGITVEWTSGDKQAGPGAYTKATKNTSVTTKCEDVFGTAGQWWGFKIKGSDITPTFPLPYPVDRDRLFFRVTIDNFHPNHPNDFHDVPVVAVLDTFPDFTGHYVMGMGLFTIGNANNALQFDTEVIGHS
jgi:hypothetical protein